MYQVHGETSGDAVYGLPKFHQDRAPSQRARRRAGLATAATAAMGNYLAGSRPAGGAVAQTAKGLRLNDELPMAMRGELCCSARGHCTA